MKKIWVLLAVSVVLMIGFILPAVAAEPSLTVSLRVEGKDQNLFYDKITTNNTANYNVINILMLADSQSEALSIKGLKYGYITEISGVGIGQTAGGKDNYTVMVNDIRIPFEELGTYQLKNNDSITVYYADNYGVDMMFPIIDLKKLDQGYIKFSYEKLAEDGKSVTNLPISGATVTWYCDNVPFNYLTDGQGGIYIDKNALTSGSHKVTLELKDENGTPMLLRLAPDFTVEVPVGIGDRFAVYVCAVSALLSLTASVALSIGLKKKRI